MERRSPFPTNCPCFYVPASTIVVNNDRCPLQLIFCGSPFQHLSDWEHQNVNTPYLTEQLRNQIYGGHECRFPPINQELFELQVNGRIGQPSHDQQLN
jgi:hypothetical protein